MGSLSSLFFNPAVVGSLHALSEEGAASLLVRDGLQNYGIVDESKKEDPNLGKEISLIMWGSWLIWGGGSFLLKRIYFNVLKPLLPMAEKANSNIMETSQGHQQLTQEKALNYAKVLEQRFAGKEKSLQHEAHQLAQQYRQLAQKNTKTFMHQMNLAKFGGLLFAGCIPAFLTGLVLPKIAQERSKRKLGREATLNASENTVAPQQRLVVQEESPRKALSEQWKDAQILPYYTDAEANDLRQGQNTTEATEPTEASSPPSSKPRSAFAKVVNYFNENPNMTNLVLVDSAVTASRVLTAEDNNDKIRWATYEAIFLYMMYLGSGQVRDMIQSGTMELPCFREQAQLKKLNFNTLSILNHHLKSEKNPQQLKHALDSSFKAFGITPEQLKNIKDAFETYTVHHHLLNVSEKEEASKKLSHVMEPVVIQIKEALQNSTTPYQRHDNVLVDLLMSEGVMPVHTENWWNALRHGRFFNPKVLGMDISQSMPAFDDGHGEKGVANLIYRLSQSSQVSLQEMKHRIKAAYIGHSVGIFASLAAGFIVMGRLSPLIQSWLSEKVTGQDLPDRLNIKNYKAEAHKYKPTLLDAHV
ncbi:MAG: hypothetical protein HEQ32_05145 [Vampirovibrio sp.]